MRKLAATVASLVFLLSIASTDIEARDCCSPRKQKGVCNQIQPNRCRKKSDCCLFTREDIKLYLGAKYLYIWPCQCRPSFTGGTITDGQVEADNISTGEIDITFFFARDWAIEASAWGGKHTFRGLGTDLAGYTVGETWFLSTNYILQYHIPMCDCFPDFDFFVGLGVDVTWFFAESTNLANTNISLDRLSVGAVGQFGVNYAIDRCWVASFDAKIIQMNTNILLLGTTSGHTKLDLNPWVFGVGLKRIF
ncbi:MAG: OmpW family protein [Chlamydiales bacterium]|nr:OmpW family protein [Chlamydiia bacterium]MCP5507082.1 OmpW family protein [Chlamydiales bacterium]